MTTTLEEGRRYAAKKASEDWNTFVKGNRQFGRMLNSYCGHAPKSLGLGHLVNTNPTLNPSPDFTPDRRRGFMFAPISAAQDANIAWENLDDPTTCAYIWGRDINAVSLNLYTSNQTLFAEPNEDFWRCSYLAHRLGETPFAMLWSSRDKTQSTVYDGVIYTVNTRLRGLPGWSVVKLKRVIFFDCEHVFALAKRGGNLLTKGFGIQPVLSMTNMQHIFK
jgi:hypothetical protein